MKRIGADMIEKEEADKLNAFKTLGGQYLKYLCPDCKLSVEILSSDLMREIQSKKGVMRKISQARVVATLPGKVQNLICQNCKLRLAKEYKKKQGVKA